MLVPVLHVLVMLVPVLHVLDMLVPVHLLGAREIRLRQPQQLGAVGMLNGIRR